MSMCVCVCIGHEEVPRKDAPVAEDAQHAARNLHKAERYRHSTECHTGRPARPIGGVINSSWTKKEKLFSEAQNKLMVKTLKLHKKGKAASVFRGAEQTDGQNTQVGQKRKSCLRFQRRRTN
jgi:hypothetical protein